MSLSYERALKAINLEPTDRIPQWPVMDCPAFVQELTGIDPHEHPQRAMLRLTELLDLDISRVPTSDEPSQVRFAEGQDVALDAEGHEVVRWGTGSTSGWDWGKKFCTVEEVLAFEPLDHLAEMPLAHSGARHDFRKPVADLAYEFGEPHRQLQELVGARALVNGSFYLTLFMWPLMTFGWEFFFEASLREPGRFKEILDQFASISCKVMEAWSLTDVRCFVSHDDLCYKQGPICSPRWLRANVYPWYEVMWRPLRARGIKVVFLSDGNVDQVVDDVFAAGADGILGEPTTNYEAIAKRYGQSKIIVGNADGRILLLGSREDVYAEVARCTRLGRECPGYFYSTTNNIPWNVPVENVKAFFEACAEMGAR